MIPDEREDLNRFFTAMEERIKENATKPGWKSENFHHLIYKSNTHSLYISKIEANHPLSNNYTREELKEYMDNAIDIANYAMMIYNNAKRALSKI